MRLKKLLKAIIKPIAKPVWVRLKILLKPIIKPMYVRYKRYDKKLIVYRGDTSIRRKETYCSRRMMHGIQ